MATAFGLSRSSAVMQPDSHAKRTVESGASGLAPERSGSRNVAPWGPLVAASSAREVARAWEDFAAGNEVGTGVRPEIVASWYRCRGR
ncbi:hypothetical protein WY02_27575 [Pseudonocardia sp. AL041005-10]|nr:hypothetical protein WY02_27575 [Pseudonocardia sp. AL041005-10]